MTPGRASDFLRAFIWRVGRKLYTYARGDGLNDPDTNGEYWLLAHVLEIASEPKVLLDVGANRGDWTSQALRMHRGPESLHIEAFEPSRATRAMLTARLAGHENVTIQAYALSVEAGEATFYSDQDGGGTNSLSPISGSRQETVQRITLDTFVRRSGLRALTMVKIDTEGFDLLVLRGAESALTNGLIEIVQFEYNWRWLLNHASLRDVFEFISNKPYRLGKLRRESIEFYETWHFELDRFFENNYVLVRRDSGLCALGVTTRFSIADVPRLSGSSPSVQ